MMVHDQAAHLEKVQCRFEAPRLTVQSDLVKNHLQHLVRLNLILAIRQG